MNLAEHCPPIDPIQFRDDLLDLLDQAEAEFSGDPHFDFWQFAGIRLACKYVRSREDFVPGTLPPLLEDPVMPVQLCCTGFPGRLVWGRASC